MGLDLSERPGMRRAPHFHSSISERCADQMAPEECLGVPQDQGQTLRDHSLTSRQQFFQI